MEIASRTAEITRDIQAGYVSAAATRRRSDTSESGGDTGAAYKSNEVSHAQMKAQESASKQGVDIKVAVEKLDKLIKSQRKDVDISVDEEANATVIMITKHQTGEVVTQFPPEQVLAMRAKLRNLTGWFIDKTM